MNLKVQWPAKKYYRSGIIDVDSGKSMTIENCIDRLNALEAERDALLDTIFEATADLEEGHHAEARAKLTQALTKGGNDGK